MVDIFQTKFPIAFPLIPACISNYTHYKVWDGNTNIHSETSTVQPLKFRNELVNSSRNLLVMWLRIHAGIKVKQY